MNTLKITEISEVLPNLLDHHDTEKTMKNTNESNTTYCFKCEENVKPVYHGMVFPSHQSNIPGLSGRYVNIACCPKCTMPTE